MRVAIARRPIRGLARRSRGGTFAGLLAGILIGLGTALSVAIFVTKAPVPFLNKATRAPERALDPKTPEAAPDPNKPLFSRNRADPSAAAPPEPSILFPGPDRNAPTSTERQASEPEVETNPSPGASSGTSVRPPVTSASSAQMPPTVLAPSAQALSPAPNAPARVSVPAQGAAPMPPSVAAAPASVPAQAAAPAPSASGSSGASGEGYVLQAGAFRTVEDAEAMRGRLALLGFEARVIGSEVNGFAVQRVRIGPFARMDDMTRARTKLTESGIEVSVVRVR
ncbi:MAG: SPOR domain-containing protein [Betaproteobacteria bacterium]|jgi:cell division protein FtsN|nr:SPOR domain-containing protein [Betaproteobacteria bacterium]NBY18342.1 SPOR domain-containing protein [Betaproteobacteria bacterium]